MPIATWNDYLTEVGAPAQRIQDTKVSSTTITGRLQSLWTNAPFGGVVPAAAAVPINTTLGSMGQANDIGGVMRLAQVAASLQQSGMLIICDRLSHQGGLVANLATAQTTNLPTAALTRQTSGINVLLGLEIYTAIGSTGTTVTASYTNETPTAGRTSQATVFGGTGYATVGRMFVLPLQQGDRGVTSVASVTLAATTATAGNFGVTLFQPLFMMPIPNMGSQQFLFDSMELMCGNMPQIVAGACLFYCATSFTTSTGVLLTANRFIQE